MLVGFNYKMWRNSVYSVLLLVLLYFNDVHSAEIGYCHRDLCPPGVKHIACEHNMKFSKDCPSKSYLVNITDKLKEYIVHAHNKRRNLLAGGDVPNHDAACRMGTMQWDEQLAQLATLNVMQCKMQHDNCRNTFEYPTSGQNIAWFKSNNRKLLPKNILKIGIDGWFEEHRFSNMEYIMKYQQNSQAIGHFTVMMRDDNTRVGCGWSIYQEDGSDAVEYLFTCNYAKTNILDHSVYLNCTTPASQCTTNTNERYPNLCSPEEQYQPL